MNGKRLLRGVLFGSFFSASIACATSSNGDRIQSGSVESTQGPRERFFNAVENLDERTARDAAREWNVNTKTDENQNCLHFLIAAPDTSNLAEKVQLLINFGVDVNTRDIHEITPLFLATIRRRPDIVKILLENGANPNDFRLFAIIMHDQDIGEIQVSEEMLKLLLQANVDINIPDANGDTPMHDAAQTLNLNAMQLLLRNGAKINANNAQGQTPLNVALMVQKSLELTLKKCYACITFLRENNAKANQPQEKTEGDEN
ncbi:MAG: ankyrin repeat domain-containing protein [Puniceicoccales bacterium]|jgi:ankyrin repeat protein|nr:ankyrin repeat domain-containing protein [Puniceicoccales bacterium]